MKKILLFAYLALSVSLSAQKVMTPELLWELGRVSPVGITDDKSAVIYKVSTPDIQENSFTIKTYKIPLEGGAPVAIENSSDLVRDNNLSPDGEIMTYHQKVYIKDVKGSDIYQNLGKSDAYVYDELDYRHWDTWNDGSYNHIFVKPARIPDAESYDIMEGQPYNSPQRPFGGADDYIWSPDSKKIIYVSKKKNGVDYAKSTDTDLYEYHIETGQTINLTEGMKGYDTHPSFSSNGTLGWLSMARDGYEADKQDIYIMDGIHKRNLTKDWDETVFSFVWAEESNSIFFLAPKKGTIQLFSLDLNSDNTLRPNSITQLTSGVFDITGIVGQKGNTLILTRTDMNHAAEIYTFDINSKKFRQLTSVNDRIYESLDLPSYTLRTVKTTDNKEMAVWVVYPPNFDKNKKYPTLLYLQGGPQSPLSQFYSFRWNFQVMASQGYIVVAPNRRGMPGHGTAWNEEISKDWGGQAMRDYISAIDDVSKENYVDKKRIGAIGASFGGYSAFYLAGIHENRFKTFVSHCGVFNLESMYGTTEELFFVDWDMGGPYWEKNNKVAQKAYSDFNPKNMVEKWNTPILIIQGGKDYRVPIGQGQEAFQVAQLKGLKSRFLYFPEENHWILKPQNALVWQNEFFKWLNETL